MNDIPAGEWNPTAKPTLEQQRSERNELCEDIEALARELRSEWFQLPTNNAPALSVDYHITHKDADHARAEFERLRELLEDMYIAVVEHREHEDTVQHLITVRFGSGRAAYRVVWIERGVNELCDH